MNARLQTDACDPDRLESFLNGNLSSLQEREFTLHLNSCENCRRLLERQAAEPEAWREAETLLKPSNFDSLDADGLSDSVAQPGARQPLQIQSVLDALGPTDDPQMLGRLGGYEVSGVVGSGGMGIVLKAIDKSLDRTVAIKVLAPHLASSGAARKRFAREAKAAAAVLHPNVIAIHSVSNDEVLPYLVMPYVRGTSLQKRLDTEGPLSLREILRIGSQIAAGLAAAHAQGLVHRDIKPANILLEDGVERVAITDFGLARAVDDATITHSGVIAGTPQYMSPEQARGETVEQFSDLFSLGSVLYAICTGRPPFRAESTYGVMRRITDSEPTPIREINPDIPDWLCAIIARLMSKRPSERFRSAVEVTELLEKCLAHVQQPATVPLPASLPKPAYSSATRSSFFGFKGFGFKGVLAMIAMLGFGLLGFTLLTAAPPDISGEWSSEEWGHVVLKKMNDAEYAGTYDDTFSKQPGAIQLKWSRIERRFNGTWREGDDRFGELSVRLVGDEIRGAHTTDPKSKINPATPRLADLAWTRFKETAPREAKTEAKPTLGPVRESVLPYGAPCYEQYFQFRSGEVLVVGRGPATTKEEFKEDRKKVEDAGGADICLGSSSGIQLVGQGCIFTQDAPDLHWDTFTAEQVVNTMQRANFTFGVMEPAVKDLPVTYLFKTARGEVGIMEILGIVEDERGVGKKGHGMKFRYKLVQGAVEKSTKEGESNKTNVHETSSTPAAISPRSPETSGAKSKAALKRVREFTTGTSIKTIACTPHGNLIAVANGNPTFVMLENGQSRVVDNWKPTVEILDAETGKTVVSIKLTTDEEDKLLAATERVPAFEVTALAFSPDGSALAVGTSVGQVKLFHTRTGELIRSLDDKQAKLADEKTPENLKSLTRAQGSAQALAFSPDGNLLATCGGSFDDVPLVFERIDRLGRTATGPGRLKVWDVKTGALKHDLAGHDKHANAVSFSPDGKLLASAGSWDNDRGHGSGVILWDPHTGAKIRSMTNNDNGGTWSVAFSPDSKKLAVGSLAFDKDKDRDASTGAVCLTHVATGIIEWRSTFPGPAQSMAFSPDGTNVIVQCVGRQSIRFMETKTGHEIREIRSVGGKQRVQWSDFAITPQSPQLVIGGTMSAENRGFVEAWDLDQPGIDANSARPPDSPASVVSRTFPLRFKLASDMADDLRQILLGRPGHESKPSDNNQEITVTAPPEVMKRVQTFIMVMDWPESITRQSNYEYPRQTVMRAARSFFYACAIEDADEVFSKLLSPGVLAELKGETKSEHYFDYNTGGTPDPEWEKSLRADWPGKKEAIQRFVREWNRYPLKRITERGGVAIGFGVKHFCSVSFDDAPQEFYEIVIEPERKPHDAGKESFFFSSLPPWWKTDQK